MSFNTFFIRIICCFILSVFIGLERQLRHKMVGLRTNVLVSIGAFMFMTCSFGVEVTDKTRIAAQIVSGIGFLGAGVILRDGSKVKGLNTAATLWCVAAIGVLTSSGMLVEASIGTLFVLLSNIILRIVSKRIMDYVKKNQLELCIINIEIFKDFESSVRRNIFNYLGKYNIKLNSIEKKFVEGNIVDLKMIFITYNIDKLNNFINEVASYNSVNSLNWEHSKYKDLEVEDEEDFID